MHHQGIKRLAEGLRPNAFAPDGLIEGVESPNGHFLLGVQWHPEALAERDPAMRHPLRGVCGGGGALGPRKARGKGEGEGRSGEIPRSALPFRSRGSWRLWRAPDASRYLEQH